MDVKEELTARFTDAISKSFNRVPIVGQKWFKWHGKGKEPYFHFTGTRKLAKAGEAVPQDVVKRILRHLDLAGLDVTVTARSNSDIIVKFNKRPDAGR